ncbi:hypothetical protein PsYK624_022950 [Phanerochaete sordida]|uniref:Yeast cell wall synthesis Kre9/Knh1-like N-terminal domain-containing protein n=1 Tax=Phanerochaete sordida TaxID=48140 RepID=A0A9P3L8L2_9APHY|nr:hypothetical protein PsYK624_022950 [Phanerochaete sordida]
MMFFKLSTLALLVPFVHALSIDTPMSLNSSGPAHITWKTDAGDPATWSLELVNTDIFHNSFAIANNVNPSQGAVDLTLPAVPSGAGYTLQAVNISNINQVYAQSGSFTVNPPVSTTSSSMSSTSSSSGSSTVSAGSTPSASTTPFGITVSSSGSASQATSGSGSGSSSGNDAQPTAFNGQGNGASTMGIGSWIAMIAAALAGGVVAA